MHGNYVSGLRIKLTKKLKTILSRISCFTEHKILAIHSWNILLPLPSCSFQELYKLSDCMDYIVAIGFVARVYQ